MAKKKGPVARESTEIKVPGGPFISEIELLTNPDLKVVIVVAENPIRSLKIGCGMAAAQASHAMNKLMMSYLGWLLYTNHNADALNLVARLRDEPITTAILKARDTKELLHIEQLANNRNLHCAAFEDDNVEFYGTSDKVLTAIAIGPYLSLLFEGITDYLPSWNCSKV